MIRFVFLTFVALLFSLSASAQSELFFDCEGVLGGSAFYDDCLNCVGGNTGLTPCIGGCQTGSALPSETVQNVCDGGLFTFTPVDALLPAGASWGLFLTPANGEVSFGGGGTEGPLTITGINSFPIVFNADLNGILSSNGWGALYGSWFFSTVIYFEEIDPNTGDLVREFCGQSAPIFVTFGACDCAGVAEGGAYFDACGACVGGTTGASPCNPACFTPVVQAPGLGLNFAFTSASTQGWGEIVGVYPNITMPAVRYIDESGGANLGCVGAANANELAGKVVLIDRGNCQFTAKALNAQNAGAAAVVIVNNIQGTELVFMGIGDFATLIDIPVVSISYDDGQLLYAQMQNGDVLMFIGNACDPSQLGCTVLGALNYDPSASIDDGSCLFEVVIRVDMSNEIVDPNGVHIAGNWQGFNPAATPMINEGNGIWSYTDAFGSTLLEYYFLNGNDFNGIEPLPFVCASQGYRTWSVAEGTQDPFLVCFGSCAGCNDIPTCSVGDQALASEITVCDGETFVYEPANAVIPGGGGFGILVTPINPLSGPTFNFYLSNLTVPYVLDNDLSGILSANGFAPLEGTFNIFGFVYTDPSLPLETICSTTDEVTFTFGPCVAVPGCIYAPACNFNPSATTDDGSCDFASCSGCTSLMACNFDPSATIDDGSCDYAFCAGCTYFGASNYNPSATLDDGSCIIDGGSNCGADLNGDETVNVSDLLIFLTAYGNPCE